jgi:hypothetical protein
MLIGRDPRRFPTTSRAGDERPAIGGNRPGVLMTASRLGCLSGRTVAAVGVAYAIVLSTGFVRHGLSEPIADPILAAMEVLTLASAFPLLLLVTAVLFVAPEARRIRGVLALCFIVMFATATSAVHVVELTAGRQLGSRGLVWPSTTYAVELLAWDLFLGAALMFTAAALDPIRTPLRLRRLVQVTGVLCLAGIAGPVIGNMRLQLIGVFGYAVLLPLAAFGLASWFRANPE